MAPNGWATKEEREFLTTLIPEYEACQVKRRYKAFWQRANAEFLAKFPVLDKLFPGIKSTELSPEQKEMYTAALIKQQQRLKEWFRWQFNPRSRNAGTVLSKKDLHTIYNGRSRVHRPHEVFAKLFPDQVDEAKAARCESKGLAGRQTLHVWQEVAKELYDSASHDQVDAVKKALEEEELTKFNKPAATPSCYYRYLKKLPTMLGAAITPAVELAGVLAFVTIVGPDPEQNGKIVCKSLQFGDKPETPLFSQVWEGHDTVYAEELARFARRHEFSPEVCASRSLNHVAISELSETNDDPDLPQPMSTLSPNTASGASPLESPTTSSSPVEAQIPVGEMRADITVNPNSDPPPHPSSSTLPLPSSSSSSPSSVHGVVTPVVHTASSGVTASRTRPSSPSAHRSLVLPVNLNHQTQSQRSSISSAGDVIGNTATWDFNFFDRLATAEKSGEEQNREAQEGVRFNKHTRPLEEHELIEWDFSEADWARFDTTLERMRNSSPARPPARLHSLAELRPPSGYSRPVSPDRVPRLPPLPPPSPGFPSSLGSQDLTGSTSHPVSPSLEELSNDWPPSPPLTAAPIAPRRFFPPKDLFPFSSSNQASRSVAGHPLPTPSGAGIASTAGSPPKVGSSNPTGRSELSSSSRTSPVSLTGGSRHWLAAASDPKKRENAAGWLVDRITPPNGNPSVLSRLQGRNPAQNDPSPQTTAPTSALRTTLNAPQLDLSQDRLPQTALQAPSSPQITTSPFLRPRSTPSRLQVPAPGLTLNGTPQSSSVPLTAPKVPPITIHSTQGSASAPSPNSTPQMPSIRPPLTITPPQPSSILTPPPSSPQLMIHSTIDPRTVTPAVATREATSGSSNSSPQASSLLPTMLKAPEIPIFSQVAPPQSTPAVSNPTSARSSPSEVTPQVSVISHSTPNAPQTMSSTPIPPHNSPAVPTQTSAFIPPTNVISQPSTLPSTHAQAVTTPGAVVQLSPCPTTSNSSTNSSHLSPSATQPGVKTTKPLSAPSKVRPIQVPIAPPDYSASPSANLLSDRPSEDVTPESANQRRRSARGTVPSRRHEQLQLIGTNAAQVMTDSGAEDPAWFTVAVENLKACDLGEEWLKLVDLWAALESLLGYGKTSKGSLRAEGRPEEWAKWTAKTWQGTRRYDLVPEIHDPADIGIAFAKWWASLQPPFRAASEGDVFPRPIYSSPDPMDISDPWASLRKSGHNGFVSVLLLLAWWGRAAVSETSEWQDDSLPAWHHLVRDVAGVVAVMTASFDPSGRAVSRKRPLEQEKENTTASRGKRKRRVR